MTELPFERTLSNAYEWTDKAFELLLGGGLAGEVHRKAGLEVAVVSGACPRCNHQFRFSSSQKAVGTGGRTLESTHPAGDDEEYVGVEVVCSCDGDHPGRSETEHGCGITFRIEVRPEGHDD